MVILLAALLSAMPVRPAADAPRLIPELGAGKPLVLHFWATWCEACREEFPRLRPELVGLPARGVAVALVSIDRPRDRRKAEKMLARYRLEKLPAVLLDAPEPDPVAMSVGDPHWEGTLPATFVFDAQGKLMRSFIGRTEARSLEQAVRAVTSNPTGEEPTRR
jgi:thiol-disulfide isomerase/thioredoxin